MIRLPADLFDATSPLHPDMFTYTGLAATHVMCPAMVIVKSCCMLRCTLEPSEDSHVHRMHVRLKDQGRVMYLRAVWHSGAVNIEGGAVTLTGNAFSNNLATQFGGAIFYSQGCIDIETIPGEQAYNTA